MGEFEYRVMWTVVLFLVGVLAAAMGWTVLWRAIVIMMLTLLLLHVVSYTERLVRLHPEFKRLLVP